MLTFPTAVKTSRAGMTLLEVVFVITILAVAFQMTVGALANVSKAEPSQRETSLALDGLRDMVETLRGETVAELFARYNADPADDPGGAGTAPGAAFDIPGLDPQAGDPDGLVGRVEFPEVGGALREDLADRGLGMPRDLDLDGVIDGLDHAGNYRILPFRVHAEWLGFDRRPRTLTLYGSCLVP